MKNSYTIHPDRKFISISHEGQPNIDEVKVFYQKISEHELFDSTYKGIADWRRIESRLSLEEVHELGNYVVENQITTGDWAVLVSKSVTEVLAIMYSETVSPLYSLQVFTEEEEASKFLGFDITEYLEG